MLFRLATAPDRLGWSPDMFWKSTAVELEMALEGLAGKFGTQPFISREEVRRIAASFGKRRSLKENPAAQVWGESRNQNDPS